MKTVLFASAIALSLTGASFAQTSTGPTVANPPSQGKAAPQTSNDGKGAMGTSGNAGGPTKQTPGGETGPSGQQAKPK